MTDPFSSVRRRAAAVTYGRKAQVARRIATATASQGGSNSDAKLGSLPPAGRDKQLPFLPRPPRLASSPSSSSSSSSSETSDSSNEHRVQPHRSQKSSKRRTVNSGKEQPWTHRSAHSAISKLDSLYESTKTSGVSLPACSAGQGGSTPTDTSSRAIFDSTKGRWDLGEAAVPPIPTATFLGGAETHPKKRSCQQLRRIVRDNTDMVVAAAKAPDNSGGIQTNARAKTVSKKASGQELSGLHSSSASEAFTKAKDKTAKPEHKPMYLKRARSSADTNSSLPNEVGSAISLERGGAEISSRESPTKVTKTRSHTRSSRTTLKPAPQPPGSKDAVSAVNQTSPWDMGDLLSSSPIFSRAKNATRRGAPARKPSTRRGTPQTLSSPPSTPGRLASSRGSRQGNSGIGSDSGEESSSNPESRISTPKRQVNNRRILGSMRGPSTATSKRLQKRALSQNVVYTYGHARDVDELEEEFSRALGAAGLLGASSQPLLESSDPFNDSDDARSDTTVLAESFRQRICEIMQGIGSSATERTTACQQLAASLEQKEFRNHLLHSKHWLPTLLQTMQRSRDDPVVVSAMMLLIAAAFTVPETMQTLVFDRQALESVAGILKSTFESDLLLLRRSSDFSTLQQHHYVAQVCRSARRCGFLAEAMPLSTYNLALAALHTFTRNDDVGYLAMAGLLRSEMHESGCLGLVIERVFASSIPSFVRQQGKANTASSTASWAPFSDIHVGNSKTGDLAHGNKQASPGSSDNGGGSNDDMWMDFDLPDEPKGSKLFSQPNTKAARKPVSRSASAAKTAGAAAIPGSSNKDRHALAIEPDASRPSFASIALELEMLRFCATASVENQDEVLREDSSIPSLLSLLAICQQASVVAQGPQLVRALETAVLVLQLLVNLSNSNPGCCARFIACKGLDVVVKSIVFVSQNMQSLQLSRAAAGLSPRSKAIAGDASDLRYDILLITSALLTNIVEADPSSAAHFDFVLQSPECALSKRCFPECICAARISLVALLAQMFSACHAAPSNADAAIAAGYLSVLLGFLMCKRSASRDTILKHLPGQQASVVVSHIEQFIQVSDSVSKRFGNLLGGLGKAPGFSLGHPASHNAIPRSNTLLGGSTSTSSNAIAAPKAAFLTRAHTSGSADRSGVGRSLQSIIDTLNGF
ncbi:hypothetical protein GQ54DRAFT_308500 [Martensiomyces pterosporus]|nr:hypothetical protein GQ54DRAFT_308500 [Martensiomyces pterosporus]